MKRTLDIILSLICLIIFAIPMSFIAITVRIFLGHPIIFRQARPGLNGKVFEMYKFRTMTDAKTKSGELLPDADRLTKFGLFLRRTSLDELPEILNVLRGEMSFVGPRPLLVQYLDHYTPTQARRHEVRPGITGWAQVNGRNTLSWEDRFALDVWYVDHQTLWLDFKILCLTVLKVLKREGVAAKDAETMAPFAKATTNDRRS